MEHFYEDFQKGRLTGLDKAYVNRLIAANGEKAVSETLANKKLGILFNRCQETGALSQCLDRLREYLDTLDQYEKYKDRIHAVGMVPHHKIINITNNRGALFYDKDSSLTGRMDLVAQSILTNNQHFPTLSHNNREILQFLQKKGKPSLTSRFSRIASSFG